MKILGIRQRSELVIHSDIVKSIDVHADRVVTGGADRRLSLLSLSPGGDLDIEAHAGQHRDLVNSVRFSPGGGRVASASKDHAVRVWDLQTGGTSEIGRHDNWVLGATWNDDGSLIASGSEDGTLRIWDAAGGGERARIDLGYPANAVDWRGDRIAVANGNRTLYLIDARTGDVDTRVKGARQLLWSVSLSPDGERVAWTGRDRFIRVLDIVRDESLEIPAHVAQAWSVAWDDGGERLISASADGTAAIWAGDGRPLERVTMPTWVRAARFAGERIVLAGEDGRIRVLEQDGGAAKMPSPIAIPAPPRACAHWDPRVTETKLNRCEECDSVESLRLCVTCGHVGCCESQRAHGTKHWQATGHPNTIPTPSGPLSWRWCYADDMYVKRVTSTGGRRVA